VLRIALVAFAFVDDLIDAWRNAVTLVERQHAVAVTGDHAVV